MCCLLSWQVLETKVSCGSCGVLVMASLLPPSLPRDCFNGLQGLIKGFSRVPLQTLLSRPIDVVRRRCGCAVLMQSACALELALTQCLSLCLFCFSTSGETGRLSLFFFLPLSLALEGRPYGRTEHSGHIFKWQLDIDYSPSTQRLKQESGKFKVNLGCTENCLQKPIINE